MVSWWTFALQVVNFLVLVWLLHRFLYRPVQRTIAERRHRAEAAAAHVVDAQHEADDARAALERDRALQEAARERIIDDARAAAAAEHDQVLAKARVEADELVAAGRHTLAEERAAVLRDVERQAAELGTAIAERVLMELGSAAVDEALLARLDGYLERLPAERRRALTAEAAASGVEIVTAHELAPEVIAHWRARLARRLGEGISVSFRGNDALVAGAELHVRTSIVRLSWRDAVAHAEELVRFHAATG